MGRNRIQLSEKEKESIRFDSIFLGIHEIRNEFVHGTDKIRGVIADSEKGKMRLRERKHIANIKRIVQLNENLITDYYVDFSRLSYMSLEKANKHKRDFQWSMLSGEDYKLIIGHLVKANSSIPIVWNCQIGKDEESKIANSLLYKALMRGVELRDKVVEFDRQFNDILILAKKFGFIPKIRSKRSITKENRERIKKGLKELSVFHSNIESSFNAYQSIKTKEAKGIIQSLPILEARTLIRLMQNRLFAKDFSTWRREAPELIARNKRIPIEVLVRNK